MFEDADADQLVAIFGLRTKRELEKYCRTLTIRHRDFALLVYFGQCGALEPYCHVSRFFDHPLPDLTPTQDELDALSDGGLGPAKGKAKKAITKVSQFLIDRRHFVAHLFYTPDRIHWYLFYFDQRDMTDVDNRWKHGPHIHLVSSLWSNWTLPDIWKKAQTGDMTKVSAIHIRFDRTSGAMRSRAEWVRSR